MARPALNRQWLLASRPAGWPTLDNFRLEETPIPEPGPGQMRVRALWLSVDPYLRGLMRDVKSYLPPVPVGGVMEGSMVARVESSHVPGFKPGDIVESLLGWQDFAVTNGRGVRIVDPALAPVSTALGVLGMPGLTAYFGVVDICQARPGDTLFISGAAGAVGSVAGQIAKLMGCRVVGSAGSDDKVAWLTETLGFDAAFNYKTEDPAKALTRLCPEGINAYFDNVGGTVSDAVFSRLAEEARVAVCGQISQYNLERPEPGPRLFGQLIAKRARVEGFLVTQFASRYREGLERLARWVRQGRIQYRETVVEGLENTPKAFLDMMRGENTGKQVVHVAD